MLLVIGKYEMKFVFVNFEVENNSFIRNFLGYMFSGKEFVNKYWLCIIDIFMLLLMSGIIFEVLVIEVLIIEVVVIDFFG